MDNFENVNTGKECAPWISTAAFNTYWTYSFIARSSYYAMISPEYYDFMNRWVRNWLYWYDGYVPYFHNQENGILSTRIATALVDRTAQKVVGGRIMYKNAGKEKNDDKDALNNSLKFISGEWAKESNFSEVVSKAVKYAAAAGTSLIKLNKDRKGLWAEALRFDSFLPAVGARGNLVEVKCFLRPFTNLGISKGGVQKVQTYYVIEYRYFGDYEDVAGRKHENVPLVEYIIKRFDGTVTGGDYISQTESNRILMKDLPKELRKDIGRAYTGIMFDCPQRLPFTNNLGCELVKWTDSIGNIPELPFGESLLSRMIAILMSWDYYFSAFNTDMYLGRGRVLVPKYFSAGDKGRGGYNSGIDGFLFTKIDSLDPDKQSPTPIQFDLRSADWKEIRNMLIENIAVQTGMNISTIASFLNDNTARTAREVSTQENETAGFVDDKRQLIEKPINRILKLVLLYYGYEDDVVVRWSGAGLTNRYTLTELINQAKSGGFLSRYKAVQMFNYDDDDEQVQEEYERIKEEVSAESEMTETDLEKHRVE